MFSKIYRHMKDKDYFFLKYDVKLFMCLFFNTVSGVKIARKGIFFCFKSESSMTFTYCKHDI